MEGETFDIPITAMPNAVDDFDTFSIRALDRFFLNSDTALPHWSKANTMSDDVQCLDALTLGDKLRSQRDSTLHDPDSQVGINRRVPLVCLQAASQDTAASRRAMHDVNCLVVSIIRSRSGGHNLRIISDKHDLAASRIHVLVFHAFQKQRGQACAIDNQIGSLSSMMQQCSICDVLADVSFEDNAVL